MGDSLTLGRPMTVAVNPSELVAVPLAMASAAQPSRISMTPVLPHGTLLLSMPCSRPSLPATLDLNRQTWTAPRITSGTAARRCVSHAVALSRGIRSALLSTSRSLCLPCVSSTRSSRYFERNDCGSRASSTRMTASARSRAAWIVGSSASMRGGTSDSTEAARTGMVDTGGLTGLRPCRARMPGFSSSEMSPASRAAALASSWACRRAMRASSV